MGQTVARVRSDGATGLRESAYELYEGVWRRTGWHVSRGTNVFDREWDTLVILDACRVDLMREVVGDCEFLPGDVESMASVGSMSEEWLHKTFTDEYADEMERTAYVTANVFTEEVLDESDFHVLDEVWRYAWDDETGTILPGAVTDRAIDVARNENPDRLIVHYMQPHHPFVGEQRLESVDADPFGRDGGTTAVDALRRSEVTYEAFWAAYKSNLEAVLEALAVLLENHDAERVAVTADHGDALGEWGIYDHPAGFLHPAVTHVPWLETTATDTGDYEPELEQEVVDEADVEARLRSLGYV